MPSFIELLNRKTALGDQIAVAVKEERMADAHRMEGQIQEIEEQLRASAEEEEQRAAEARAKASSKFRPRNLAQAFLGPRGEFRGIAKGDERTFRNATLYIDDPTVEETTLPSWGESPLYNFVGSIAHGTCEGDVKFFRRGTRTIGYDVWTPGTDQSKTASAFTWEKETAQLEMLATYVPIEVPTLEHYGELQSIITNELTIGYNETVDAHVLSGTNSNGIVGVLNTTGIQTYTAASGDHVVDSIRKMVTLAVTNSRMYPTCVCVAPQVKEAIDLLKDDNGAYLTLMTNGHVWSLPVIEDVNLAVTDDSTHYGALVYYGNAATLMTRDALTLRAGTVNEQFIQNQLSLLMEGENALKVVYPDAFVYCADAITVSA